MKNLFLENDSSIVLASASPRRREILEMMGIEPIVAPSDCDEDIPVRAPAEYAMELSRLKAESVFESYPEDIVIGADTIVVLGEEILGKPKDEEDAFGMLKRLSGKTHKVITGVCICSSKRSDVFYDETMVTMYDNSDDILWKYINTGDPMDKAGAYGIQGVGSILVKHILGDFYNVMGLPIGMVMRRLLR